MFTNLNLLSLLGLCLYWFCLIERASLPTPVFRFEWWRTEILMLQHWNFANCRVAEKGSNWMLHCSVCAVEFRCGGIHLAYTTPIFLPQLIYQMTVKDCENWGEVGASQDTSLSDTVLRVIVRHQEAHLFLATHTSLSVHVRCNMIWIWWLVARMK